MGVAACAMIWAGFGRGLTWADTSDSATVSLPAPDDLSAAFREASGRVLPSVVTISTSSQGPMQIDHRMPRDFPRELEPMLKEFFGGELPRMEVPGPQGRGYQEEGTGSGVIIDSSGIILTNHHVVGGADHVIVTLQDGREFTATDIRTDHSTDVAILRIEGAGELPAATLGNSDALQIGDWVLAVGSPFGLDQTVTAGIVSALSRGMGIAEREDFIQTDAAINPGNSGGPLVNLRGEVVGINTAISTRGGGSDGIGFAVPINLATWITDQLVDDGIVHRAFLGVGIQQLNSELVDQLNLESMQGALVTEVRPGTAAEDAGLELGDVIVRFDEHVVRDPRDLQNVVERSAIDDGHELTVIRDGNEMTLTVTLQEMPGEDYVATNDTPPAASEFDSLGIEVSNLTADMASELGMSDVTGVVITDVQRGSAAAKAGLRPGMVISRVGHQQVSNVNEFRDALAELNMHDGVLLHVQTGEGSRFVVIKMM